MATRTSKNNWFNKQNNNFARVRASRFIVHFFPVLHDYDVKMPNFAFYGGRKQVKQRLNSISLFELGYGPLKFSFRRIRLHLAK